MSEYTQVIERLARMEEKQDHLLDKIIGHTDRQDGHEQRIRNLETSGARMLGMGAVIATFAGLAGSRVLDLFSGGTG